MAKQPNMISVRSNYLTGRGSLATETVYQIVNPYWIDRIRYCLTHSATGGRRQIEHKLGRRVCTREDETYLEAELKCNSKGTFFFRVVTVLN